jgi:hypothetical protein
MEGHISDTQVINRARVCEAQKTAPCDAGRMAP